MDESLKNYEWGILRRSSDGKDRYMQVSDIGSLVLFPGNIYEYDPQILFEGLVRCVGVPWH